MNATAETTTATTTRTSTSTAADNGPGAGSTCPLCDETRSEVVGTVDRWNQPLINVRCVRCGLVRIDPQPTAEALRAFYEHEYRKRYKGSHQPKPKHVHRAGVLALQRFAKLRPHVPAAGRVLDVGSGTGAFLYVLRHHGFAARGMELDPSYAAFAREQLGVDVLVEAIMEADLPAGGFEAVSLFHVLEHLPDPVGALRRCREWLAPGGVLVVEVPNIESVYQHPIKRFHPAHLFGFTRESLRLAGELAGFSVVGVDVVECERNVFAVFRRAEGEPRREKTAAAIGPVPPYRRESVLRYQLRPTNWWRFAARVWQNLVEQAAVRRAGSPRAVLDALLARHGHDGTRR